MFIEIKPREVAGQGRRCVWDQAGGWGVGREEEREREREREGERERERERERENCRGRRASYCGKS
jgi:hypothetical protein